MAALHNGLFVKVLCGKCAQHCLIAKPRKAVHSQAREATKLAHCARAEILDIRIDNGWRIRHIKHADNVTGLSALLGWQGLQCQPNIKAGNITREQQVTLGIIGVEDALPLKLRKITL